jgi:hypothetical protein
MCGKNNAINYLLEIPNYHGGENEHGCLLGCLLAASIIALIMEATSTSETSVNIYQTTRRNNPKDSHLQITNRVSYISM